MRLSARRPVVFLGLASAFVVFCGGCMDPVENRATDNEFLRRPGDKTPHLELGNKPILPLSAGNRWEMALHSEDQAGNEIPGSRGKETVETRGTERVGDKAGTVVAYEKNGEIYREEIYENDSKGISLLAAVTVNKNKREKMTMTPPIPVIHLPIKEGEFISWDGILKYQNTSAPGTALSRIGFPETVKTPAGSFEACRVDTIVTTTIQGRQASFPTTRWVAPGVGVIRQKMLASNTILFKDLKSYKIAGN